jgi:serine/threonine protein phosphatase PrpC
MNFKVFHTHKKSSLTYNFVQDKFYINPENKTIAIADGTTQSFRSEFWSELLVQEFCKHPTFETKDFLNLSKSLADKLQSSPPVFSEKTAIASLERDKFSKGSTSTFLGIQFRDQNTFDVLNVGDCNLFIIKKNGDIISYPFDSIDDLNNNQAFLNTINLLNEEPDPIDIALGQLKFEDGDKLLLCTDAISRLFLSDKKWIDEIVNFDNFDLFIKKIEDLWSDTVLEEDDITIIYMSKTLPNTLYINPPVGFSFPEPQPTPSFIPMTPLPGEDDSNLKLTDMDIKTIMHNFNCIQNDFIEIKKKQKFHEVLLLSTVGLLSIILLVLVFNFSSEETPVVNAAPAAKTEKKTDEPSKQVNDKVKTNKK